MTRSVTSMLLLVVLAVAGFALGRNSAGVRGEAAADVARAALENPDPIERTAQLARLLPGLDAKSLGDVEAVYRDFFEPTLTDSSILLLAEAFAVEDPAGGLDRVERWPMQFAPVARQALLRGWGRRNNSAALQWIEGVPDPQQQSEDSLAVLSGWAESGDPEIWVRLPRMATSLAREGAISTAMLWVMAREGTDEMIARVEQVPDNSGPDFKWNAMLNAAGLLAIRDPDVAFDFASRHAENPMGSGMLRRVGITWSRIDPDAAMSALLALPPSEERDWGLDQTYLTWLRRDRRAALAWLPESAAGDPRYAPLAKHYAVFRAQTGSDRGASIREAIEWAERVGEEEERHKALIRLGVLWLSYEPDAAADWIAERGIEREVREFESMQVFQAPHHREL